MLQQTRMIGHHKGTAQRGDSTTGRPKFLCLVFVAFFSLWACGGDGGQATNRSEPPHVVDCSKLPESSSSSAECRDYFRRRAAMRDPDTCVEQFAGAYPQLAGACLR